MDFDAIMALVLVVKRCAIKRKSVSTTQMNLTVYVNRRSSASQFYLIFVSVFCLKFHEYFRLDQFSCKSGECISKDVLCDGMKNCKDASDETEAVCLNSYCPSFGFRCAYGACVRGDSKCNNIKNCFDNSDESVEVCPQLNLTFVTAIDKTTASPVQTTTAEPPAGACLIPAIKFGKAVNVNFGDNYKAGDFVEEYEVVKIVCNSKYSLLLVQELDNEAICTGGLWNKRFPKCQSEISLIIFYNNLPL